MTPQRYVQDLSSVQFENTFNPYSDTCPVHDGPTSSAARRKVLTSMLKAATSVEVDAIWIGRDLGYRGGRRTGLALTDDVHIADHAARWGIVANRPTRGAPQAERTAAVVWSVLERINVNVFLWNVFPLHPHEPGTPFSNRAHNSRERQAGEELLAQLISLLKPRRLIAIGNDAATSALRLADGLPVTQVRHPSYGGQAQFLDQMRCLYGIDSQEKQSRLL